MIAHQAKKLDTEALYQFRDRFGLPIPDADVEHLNIFTPKAESEEMLYLHARRAALGGYLPARVRKAPAAKLVAPPALTSYAKFALEAAGKQMSTTMAAVRMMSGMLKDKGFGPRIVPIVADEARTFGMDNLFRQIGIYAPEGQLYEPEDAGSMLYYKESADGQLLEEGITEAGAISSWAAAATSYSIHGLPMLPVYIYYSMFGFQRVGDLIWAAADQRARGFLLGATAGRTTLSGEGLQHQDGTSQLIAATIPNCRAYDPTFAYELAVIMDHGSHRMMQDQVDEFYYITVMNETYAQPSLPAGSEADILKGLYRLDSVAADGPRVSLLGSGTILLEVLAAARILADYGIGSDVFSATSFAELSRDAETVARRNRLTPGRKEIPHVQACLGCETPVIAATDYVRAVPQMIAAHLPQRFTALGTDGFGRSDQRAALRAFFEVDRNSIALAAIEALVAEGKIALEVHQQALDAFGLTGDTPAPWTV